MKRFNHTLTYIILTFRESMRIIGIKKRGGAQSSERQRRKQETEC